MAEIVSRPEYQPVDVDEMIFVIEQYILEKKGVNVMINPLKGLTVFIPAIYMSVILPGIFRAFAWAYSYFKLKQ